MAGTDIFRDSCAEMIGQKGFAETVQRRIDCGCLRKDIRAPGVFIQHPLQTADLTFYSFEAVHQIALFLFIPNPFPA